MKTKKYTVLFLLLLAIVGLCSTKATGQTHPDSLSKEALYATIAHLDSTMFSVFNSHKIGNLEVVRDMFTKDLEFYHDTGGLTGYEHTIQFFRSTLENGGDLKRDLVPGTMEVYPVKNVGAMQIGQHRFCHTENGQMQCGTFKFVHVWKYEGGKWRIARVVSYGH